MIPDVVRSLKANRNITIRYPLAVRPWQHVIDPLIGYINLMEMLYEFPLKYSSSWNFGPDSSSEVNVKKIVNDFLKLWNSNIKIEVEKNDKFYESSYLALDTSKVSKNLKWKPEINYLESLKMTAKWYEAWIDNVDLYEFSREQINKLFKKNMSLDKFKKSNTKIKDLIVVNRNNFIDSRGSLLRIFSKKGFNKLGYAELVDSINVTEVKNKGTVKGFHFQKPPHSEIKIVTCIKGSISDVAIDLRSSSKTF